MSLSGPMHISVQNFTAIRCAVVEFIVCRRYDASRLFSRSTWCFWELKFNYAGDVLLTVNSCCSLHMLCFSISVITFDIVVFW